jgi:RND family efflux transporter MFP subunit
MNSSVKTAGVIAAVIAASAVGYWSGSYRNAESAAHDGHAASTSPNGEAGRKILYYRNPMGLPDTSPVPKKDPMGMDYVPVYEGGEEPQSNAREIKVSTEKVQRLGVRTEAARVRELTQTVRAVGTMQIDERRISTVSPKFEGWIERLDVSTTGQQVTRGQPLMEVYSPDLVTAQQEYLIAARGVQAVKDASPEIQASMKQLMASALTRLRNWDIADRELQRLEREGTVRRTVTLHSPVAGVVVEKPALKGMRFMPGEALYRISDLSSVWLLADVFEQDLGAIRPGQAASITVNAYPGKTFAGKVAFFYPTVTPETRTGKVRIELANPGGLLKPAMYASVELAAGPARKALTVPLSAVIDSGVRRVVLVQLGEGRFDPREVKLGARAHEYVEILDGVKEGDAVVVAANFLIDAESNLKAALSGFQAAPGTSEQQPAAKAANVSHRAEGTVDSVDLKANTVSVAHGPVAALKWPAMTMEFKLANTSLAAGLKTGSRVSFEFVERAPGEYVITKIEPAVQPNAAAGHAGH